MRIALWLKGIGKVRVKIVKGSDKRIWNCFAKCLLLFYMIINSVQVCWPHGVCYGSHAGLDYNNRFLMDF